MGATTGQCLQSLDGTDVHHILSWSPTLLTDKPVRNFGVGERRYLSIRDTVMSNKNRSSHRQTVASCGTDQSFATALLCDRTCTV